jgi:hypothetical protein
MTGLQPTADALTLAEIASRLGAAGFPEYHQIADTTATRPMSLPERTTALVAERDLLRQELEQARVRVRQLEARTDEEGDRTVIDMEIYSDKPSSRNHLSVEDAYEFLDSENASGVMSRECWNALNESEKREVARHWHHMNRARRLEVLDINPVSESCPETDWMVRALMILLWEAQAGNLWACVTIGELHSLILEHTPDFYLIL